MSGWGQSSRSAYDMIEATAAIVRAMVRSITTFMAPEWFITASAPTLMIAPVVGAYLCLSGAGLLRKGEAAHFLSDISKHPATMHAVGAVAFFTGAGLLSFHRHWEMPAEIILNLVAILWAYEGAGMIADLARLKSSLGKSRSANLLLLWQRFSIVIGVYLVIVGAIGSPT